MTTRRSFLAGCGAAVAVRASTAGADRLGIMCEFPLEEAAARRVLSAARVADFRRAQILFPWDRAGAAELGALPKWLDSEGIRCEVLSAYVNCAVPDVVLMGARAADLDRAIELAPALGAKHLVAWTGGYHKRLMTADPRNFTAAASDAICRYLGPRLKRLEAGGLTLALETYITLACPDAPALRKLFDRLPPSITAVMDPPNLTPVARYQERDAVLREMMRTLDGRIGVVHLKDFRLAKDEKSYDLPGPLGGEMNYPLYVAEIKKLPARTPIVAEHLAPPAFAEARRRLAPLFG